MKQLSKIAIIITLLALNAFSAQALKQGEYEGFMSSGFKKLRPVKGLLPSGFTFDYERGLAMYRQLPSVNMNGIFAVVASGESMEDGKLKAWRRICAERSRGLVMEAWLEKIREKFEDQVIENLQSFQEKQTGDASIQNPVGYFMEYLHQQFEKYDFSCLCEIFLSNCESAFGDCELKDENGHVARFFYMEYFMPREWDEEAALKKDYLCVSTAMRNKLVRDFKKLASSKASDWKQEQIDEMRRMAVLIFALDKGEKQWKDFLMHPEGSLPKCDLDWSEVMSHLFKVK